MMVVQVGIRLYTIPRPRNEEHSYLLGARLSGVSDVLDVVNVDERTATLDEIRRNIEFKTDGITIRRSVLFREIVAVCEQVNNPHGWTERIRRSSYRLGYLSKDDFANVVQGDTMRFPIIIPLNQESEIKIVPFLREKRSELQIIAVPLAHIGPVCNQCCLRCEACASPVENRNTEYYYEGRIYSIPVKDISRIKRDENTIEIIRQHVTQLEEQSDEEDEI